MTLAHWLIVGGVLGIVVSAVGLTWALTPRRRKRWHY